MLILLPPSEAKCAPEGSRRLDLATLSFGSLTEIRRATMRSLTALCQDEAAALKALRLGPGRRDEVVQNRLLTRAPVDAAVRVYTGVLYEALDPATLSPSALGRLNDQVAISSALWGLVRPLDAIPAYRLSAGVRLPGVDAKAWRAPIAEVLRDVPGPILDLRSGAYQALAAVPEGVQAYLGRVLLDRDGQTKVVSHDNKATKGRLVRAIARSRRRIRDVDDLIALAESIGLNARVFPADRGPHRIDLIATAL